MSERRPTERSLRAINGLGEPSPVVPTGESPALFHPWPSDVKERCRELWASHGNRNAGRVEWLYAREVPEGTATPAGVTIRQWARAEDWESWSNAELVRTRGRTLHQLQTTWLRSLQLSQEVQIDAMLGRFDDNPAAGAVRIKAAESVQRVIAQAGLLAVLPSEAEPQDAGDEKLTLAQRARRMRENIADGNKDR